MKKHNILKITIFIVAVMMLFSSCSGKNSAESSVNALFDAIRDADHDEILQNLDVTDDSSDGSFDYASQSGEVFLDTISEHVDCKILSSENVDDNTVTVRAEITSADMEDVLKDFLRDSITYALTNAFSEQQPTDEEQDQAFDEIFSESIGNFDLEPATTETDITVVKDENGEWKVRNDENLTAALLGISAETYAEIIGSFNLTETPQTN